MNVAGDGQRRLRPLLHTALFACAVLVAAVVSVVTLKVPEHDASGLLKPGDEVISAKMNPYGWSASMAIGKRFTNGLNFIPVSDRAKGPLRLISVTPILDGGPTLRVLGVLARVTPDMLPPNYQTGWFESVDGFPPTDRDATGGVDPAGLSVRVPAKGEDLNVELQIGYQVVGAGKSNQLGVRVRYEYQGKAHEVVIPSHITICAPVKATCPADHS